AVRKR
ncbi:cadmium-translocating P-type ATPase, partial [Vibrio parahaemolyticus AQ3810]